VDTAWGGDPGPLHGTGMSLGALTDSGTDLLVLQSYPGVMGTPFDLLDPQSLTPQIDPKDDDRGWLQVWWGALRRRLRSRRDDVPNAAPDGSSSPKSHA
jgi:hypothetical protein